MSTESYYVDSESILSVESGALLQPLPGDFYRDADGVTRGLTLPHHSDFCRDVGDVMRGLTLPDHSRICVVSDSPMVYGDVFDESYEDAASAHARSEFKTFDLPPKLSHDARAFLAATTLWLSGCSPAEAGNYLLTFFAEMADARVHKVNTKKFTIRAEVVVQDLHCDMKIRIYQQEQMCVVEFQRRSGDSVAFSKVYRKASRYLRKDMRHEDEIDSEMHLEMLPVVDRPLGQCIGPLLEMAGACKDLHVLSSVASVLAAEVAAPKVAEELRSPWGLAAVRQLERVDAFSVQCPTSRLSPFV